jgi:hypothetical protein
MLGRSSTPWLDKCSNDLGGSILSIVVVAAANPLPTRRHNMTDAEVMSILDRYGALIEKHSDAYMDEMWLPVDKDRMRSVFKSAWKMTIDSKVRNWVEAGWVLLANFRPEVGQTPLTDESPDPNNLTPETTAAFDRYIQMSGTVLADSQRELVAINDFKDSQQ